MYHPKKYNELNFSDKLINIQKTCHDSECSDPDRSTVYTNVVPKLLDFSQSPKIKRKSSIIILDTHEMNDKMVAINKIKQIQNPLEIINMDAFQSKLLQQLQKLSQNTIDHACILEVLIINSNEEYEFKFDMSNIPFYMTIKELSNLINQLYFRIKNKESLSIYVSWKNKDIKIGFIDEII
ncbi:hypothetical protein pb186bvf_018316 [Paramecium bursaria]